VKPSSTTARSPPAPAATAVRVRSYAREQQAHAHPFHQLVIPLAGRLELEVQGRAGRVEDGSCVLVPAGQRHAFSAADGNRFVVLDFPDGVVDGIDASAWIDRTSRTNFFSPPHRVMQLAVLLAGDVSLEASPPDVHRAWATLVLRAATGPEPSRPVAVERALRILERWALGPVRVSDVARAAGVSARHLHALFRRHVGRTPRDVALARRLDAACALLTGTDAPIAEIALRCGFADQASLTHAMRRVLGSTPGRLRRRVPS
jgi:AraC-like DNA-binding protein